MATRKCQRCAKEVEYHTEFGDFGQHYAKQVCTECNGFVGWEPTPAEHKKRRGKISVGMRMKVFERDGYYCVYCGRHRDQLTAGEYLQADHIEPVAEGGVTEFDNLVTACSPCNQGKSDNATVRFAAGG